MNKLLKTSALTLLIALTFSLTLSLNASAVTPPQPTNLKIYISPPKVPADNEVYEIIFVQLQDSKGTPARATADVSVHLSSSLTYIGSADPVITIRQGETYAAAKFYSTYTPGTTTITATATGYATVQASITTVGPVPYKLAVYCLPPVLPADGDIYKAIIVQLQDSGGTPAKAPVGDITVTLYSSNATVGTVDPMAVIKGGETYAIANFYTNNTAPGTTTITAMASGYASAQASVKTQFSSPNATQLKVHVGPPKVPAEGIKYNAVAVQLLDAKGNVAHANTTLTVDLSSSETEVGSIQQSVEIPAGKTYGVAEFLSTYRSGTTTITAAATGYTSSSGSLTTVGPIPTKLAVYSAPSALPADGRSYNSVIVQLQDSGGNPARDPIGDVTVDLFSSKPDFGNVEEKVVIPYGKTQSSAKFTSTYTAGSTDITATTAGYTSAQTKTTTYLIDMYALKVTVTANPTSVNSKEQTTLRIYVSYDTVAPAPGATLNMTSDKGGNFSSVTDERTGYYMVVFTAPAVNTRTTCNVTVNASKTGYTSGIGTIQIIVNPTTQTGSIMLYVQDQDGKPVTGATVTSTSQPQGMSQLAGTTDADGTVTFSNIPEGSYTFQIIKEGYAENNVQVKINAGQTITETIILSQAAAASMDLMAIILIIVAAVSAVGIITLVMMKKRRKTELPSDF